MRNSTDVSIIIINYNTYNFTANCILSVIEKTQDVSFEIIVVDNASSECNPQLFKDTYPQIKLIVSEKNIGFAGGNNLGIEQAKGEYILLLNSDTELINDAVSEAYRIMTKDSTIGVLSGQLLFPDKTMQSVAGRFPSLKNQLRELLRINKYLTKKERSTYYLGNEWDYDLATEADWVWGAFFMTRSSIIKELGGKLPAEFFMYGEDIDWCWRIGKLGYKISYSPIPKAYHYCGKSLEFEDENKKFYERKFPNLYKAVVNNKGAMYAFATFFIRAIHLSTLRNEKDLKRAFDLLKFLFGKKRYWLKEKF